MKKIILLISLALISMTARAMQPDVQIDDTVFASYKDSSSLSFNITLYKKENKTKHAIGLSMKENKVQSIGFAHMSYNQVKQIFHLDQIKLDKDFQNKGYGTILLALAFKECLKKSPKRIFWTAHPDSPELLPKLIKFYQKFGAKVTYIPPKRKKRCFIFPPTSPSFAEMELTPQIRSAL